MVAKRKEYQDIKLTKTDYDNFKNLKFFIEQHKKATQMIKEVDAFYGSFIKSKILTIKQLMKNNFPIIDVIDVNGKNKFRYKMENRSNGLNSEDFGWNSKDYDEYEKLEESITKYVKKSNKEKIPISEVSEYLNQNFSNKLLSIYLESDVDDMFILTDNNTLLDIPVRSKSSFEINKEETELTVTFEYVHKYKRCITPGWLPWNIDTHTWFVVFDTTTNNFLRYTKNFHTHEEQDRANRGY